MREFEKKFRIEELKIKEFEHWVVSLRPKQVTLGSLILSLKRECLTFAELREEETTELSVVFNFSENTLKSVFNAEKINYLALMMVDNQVHFHVLPRYSETVLFNNKEFRDYSWPAAPEISSSIELDEEELLTLKGILS